MPTSPRLLATLPLAATLIASLLVHPSVVHAAGDEAGGRMHARDARLEDGCRRYTYGYRVHAPNDDWTLELSILDPEGDAVHSHAFIGKYGRQGDPWRRKRVRYRICDNTSRPGVYRIKARLEWYERADDSPMSLLHSEPPRSHIVRLPVERFRLRR